MNNLTQSSWLPIVLLTCSNVFMTFAWYGHLKFKSKPLLLVIVVSWGIAFFEYLLQVPANRWGSTVYSPYQLKIIQEIITLAVFAVFAMIYFKICRRGITSPRSCASWRRWRSPFCRKIEPPPRRGWGTVCFAPSRLSAIYCFTNPCALSQNKQSSAHGCGCAKGGVRSPKPMP